MRDTLIIISALIFFACGGPNHSETNELSDDNVETKLDQDTIVADVDTVAIEEKILSQFAEEYSYFDDSLKKEVTGVHYHVATNIKLNFNGDEWLDYFIVEDHGGGPTAGYFFDGKTGDLIEGETDEDFISSGAAREIRAEVINVDCDDNQQELAVITGGGGTLGLYYFYDIYQFDAINKNVKSIFSETISSVNWDEEEESEWISEITFYGDDSICRNAILVQKGAWKEGKEYDPVNGIQPIKNTQQYHYVYEGYFEEFRIDRINCSGQSINNETLDQLARLNDWEALRNEPDELMELTSVVGDELTEQMQNGLLTINDSHQNLNFTASLDGRLNIVTYTFPSGGTAGTIHYPILQWEKSDGTYGTKTLYFQEYESEYYGWAVDFYDINKLPSYEKDIYLLIGSLKGSSSQYSAYAMVVELKDDELILDYPAFMHSSAILAFHDDLNDADEYCIACMDYDPKNYTITIEEVDSLDEIIVQENSWSSTEKEIKEKGDVVFKFENGKFELQK